MHEYRLDVAGLSLLGLGLVELASSMAGRSLVDAAGRVVVDAAPLPIVEGTVRMLGTTDKPLLRAGLLTAAAAASGLAPLSRADKPGQAKRLGPALAAAGGVVAYAAARRRLTALRASQDGACRALVASDPLPELTDGAEGWPHAEPLLTPVGRFYVTDVNLRPPLVDPTTWRLGLNAPSGAAAVGLDDLRELDLRERDSLLVCVHNRLGWDRLGHQRWTGISVARLFAAVGIELPADVRGHELVMEAVDGYRQVLPLDEVLGRDSWVVIGMDGRELSAAHGFPARVMTPGVAGQYGGVKWLASLTVAPSGSARATWVERGWPRETVVTRPMARIDHPGRVGMPPRLPNRPVSVSARTTLVGTAWAPANGGVSAVEVRVNGGPWLPTELAADVGAFSWRRWRTELDLTTGRHAIAARCIAHDGTVQVGTPSPPFPDGTTGHHTVRVKVAATASSVRRPMPPWAAR